MVKLLALGLCGYFMVVSNIFDFLIIAGFAMETVLAGSSSVSALRVLR